MTEYPPTYYDSESDTGKVVGFFSLILDHDCEEYDEPWMCSGGERTSYGNDWRSWPCWVCEGVATTLVFSDRPDNDELGLCDDCNTKLRKDRSPTQAAREFDPVIYHAAYL